jgi:hypothetical protein
MSVRVQLMLRRYAVLHYVTPRRIAVYLDGRLRQGWADASRTRSGRMMRLRARLRRKFKTDREGWL